MSPKKLLRGMSIALMTTATLSLSGCPAFAAESTKLYECTDTVTQEKYNTELLPYLCHVAMESTRGSIYRIVNEDLTERDLIATYTVYKHSLLSIQDECPEDSIEPAALLESEGIVDVLMSYKLKGK